MRLVVIGVLASFLASSAFAQSKEDKRASLTGVLEVGFKETGVGALGGGTAGSPYLLQVEKAFKAAGIRVVEAETAVSRGLPIYELMCTGMEASDATIRAGCESHLLKIVSLDVEPKEKPKTIYARTWASSLLITSMDRDRIADLEKLTGTFVDAFVADWQAANPSATPPPAPPKAPSKKK